MPDDKCPECDSRRTGPVDSLGYKLHPVGGIDCLLNQIAQLQAANEKLVAIVNKCGTRNCVAFAPMGPTHTPDEARGTERVREGLQEALQYVCEAAEAAREKETK